METFCLSLGGACGCGVLAFDPVAREDVWDADAGKGKIEHVRVGSLEEVLRETDVLTLHVPLLKSARGMIGERELRIIKKEAVLVNCARVALWMRRRWWRLTGLWYCGCRDVVGCSERRERRTGESGNMVRHMIKAILGPLNILFVGTFQKKKKILPVLV